LDFERDFVEDLTATRTPAGVIVEDDGVFAVQVEVGVKFVGDVNADTITEFQGHHAPWARLLISTLAGLTDRRACSVGESQAPLMGSHARF
jgi:hypothetical protein